jgi:hypothetical protein
MCVVARVRTATVLLCFVLGACAASSAPDRELAAARAAVIQAEPIAHRYAARELGLAQQKLARAEQAMGRNDWSEARRLAEQAELDARYAWALAQNERARSGE